MALSKWGKKAYRDTVLAAEEKGAWCVDADDPSPWTGRVDEDGVEWLPTDEEAEELCAGCPLLGAECELWLRKGDTTWGVLNGVVVDKWRVSGVDLFLPTEKEEEEESGD